MGKNKLDQALLDKSAMRDLLEKLAVKHQKSHRWDTSPVVKNTELSKIIQQETFFIKYILDKIAKDEVNFHPLKSQIIQQDKKERQIFIQNWVDKILQIRIKEVIEEELKPFINKNVYSFQKGKGPLHAIERFLTFLKSQKSGLYILQLDITKYGENIDQEIMFEILDKKLELEHNPTLKSHLKKIISFEVYNPESGTKSKPIGLASGAPLVPLFENLYLLPVDDYIEKSSPLFYCRYGDDMILAFGNRKQAEVSIELIQKEVSKIKLTIKPEKIKITDLGKTGSFEWLGYKVNNNLEVGSKEKHVKKICKEIKDEIHKHFFLLRQIGFKPRKISDLKDSLETLEKKIYQNFTNRIFHYYTSDKETKQIDTYRLDQTHKAICRNFRIDKRMGWKIIRQLKHKSANQFRMQFLRKKQWPKVPLRT